MRGRVKRWAAIALISPLLIALHRTPAQADPSRTLVAQALPACLPPQTGEYLLMVIHSTPNTEARLTEVLPDNAIPTVCDYLGQRVTRVGGFRSSERAQAWVQYLAQQERMQAFVARAPVSNDPSPTSQPFPQPSPPSTGGTSSSTYNPQPLGNGYAVLVSYFNHPEVATDLQQVSRSPIGVVSYEQRPYLLASHTTDPASAANLLRNLSDRGFSAMIVDGRRAVLLRSNISP